MSKEAEEAKQAVRRRMIENWYVEAREEWETTLSRLPLDEAALHENGDDLYFLAANLLHPSSSSPSGDVLIARLARQSTAETFRLIDAKFRQEYLGALQPFNVAMEIIEPMAQKAWEEIGMYAGILAKLDGVDLSGCVSFNTSASLTSSSIGIVPTSSLSSATAPFRLRRRPTRPRCDAPWMSPGRETPRSGTRSWPWASSGSPF